MENYVFLEKYGTSEGAVSHNVPITRYQVRFYANNYFELLPIVFTAFSKAIRIKDYLDTDSPHVCKGCKGIHQGPNPIQMSPL